MDSPSSTTSKSDESRPMNDTTLPKEQGAKTKPARQKTGVRKGFGLHDWHRLVKSSKNLSLRETTTTSSGFRNIRPSEIQQHDSIHDGWISLHGKVYNVTPYLPYHPGGVSILKPVLGRDASALFDKYHRWVNVDGLIGTLLIGYLEKDEDLDENEGARSYLPQQHRLQSNDGFAVPAPRPPKAAVAQILSSGRGDQEEDDADPLGT